MPDVHIDLIGRNRVGNAARGAARDLDKLAAKIDKFNAKRIDAKKAKVKTDVDLKGADSAAAKLQKTLTSAGDRAGTGFRTRFRKKLIDIVQTRPQPCA